jgi:hypothetical protein
MTYSWTAWTTKPQTSMYIWAHLVDARDDGRLFLYEPAGPGTGRLGQVVLAYWDVDAQGVEYIQRHLRHCVVLFWMPADIPIAPDRQQVEAEISAINGKRFP